MENALITRSRKTPLGEKKIQSWNPAWRALIASKSASREQSERARRLILGDGHCFFRRQIPEFANLFCERERERSASRAPANLITARGLQLQQSGKKHNPAAAEEGIILLRRCSPEWRAPLLPPYRSPTLLLPLLHHLYLFTAHPLQQPPHLFFYIYTRQKPTSIIALQYNVIKLLERAGTTRRAHTQQENVRNWNSPGTPRINKQRADEIHFHSFLRLPFATRRYNFAAPFAEWQ